MVDFVEGHGPLSIGIIGGGRGGMQLFEFFHSSQQCKVRFVVDPNPAAPAMAAAEAGRIPVFSDLEEALRSVTVDYLVETTGLDGIEQRLAQWIAGTQTGLLTHGVARLLIQVMSEHRRRTRDEVSDILVPIKSRLAEGQQGSQATVAQINSVMSSMQMLSLNASIEAAKAGTLGRGFAVVADQMGKSVDTVRRLTQEIEAVNQKIVHVSEQIDQVIERLH